MKKINASHLDRFYVVYSQSNDADDYGRPSQTLTTVASGYGKVLRSKRPQNFNNDIPDDNRMQLEFLVRYNPDHFLGETLVTGGRRYDITGYREDVTQDRQAFGIFELSEELNTQV